MTASAPSPAPSEGVSTAAPVRRPVPGLLSGLLAGWHRIAPAALGRVAGLASPPWPMHCLVCAEPCAPDAAALADPVGGGVVGRPGALRPASPGCGPTAGTLDLCRTCLGALPWMRAACARCARPLPAPAAACGLCLRRPPPQARSVAAFVYQAPLDRLLPRLKFHQDLAAGRSLALAMAPAFAEALAEGPPPAALVPLPLHRSRLRARGFDQTLELARPLARALALPLRADLLQRRRATAPQSRLDAAARRRNLRDAFTVVPPRFGTGSPLPAHVVLFDDVMTTGATVQSAATALLRAGVKRVDVWVCARVP